MSESPQRSEGVKIALIGAAATLGAAIIAGVFGLLPSRPAEPAPVVQPTVASAPSPTPDTPAPMLFAAKIAPDGEALNPSDTFPAGVTDLYVVFSEESMPPGLAPFTERPIDGAYYAYFKPTGNPQLNTFGWRWLKEGQTLVDFNADPSTPPFWLQRFNYEGKGIFGEWGPGTYTVVILVNGTPMLSSELHITE